MGKINMKKVSVFVLALVVICMGFAGIVTFKLHADDVWAKTDETIITLQIGNPEMKINNDTAEIDPGRGTTPVIVNDRTLLPIRAIIEAVGGTVGWSEETQTATLTYGDDEIRLTLNSSTAYLNDEAQTLDVVPVSINDRTMLPIRFIAESFQFGVEWDGDNSIVTITAPSVSDNIPQPDATSQPQGNINETDVITGLEHRTENENVPEVFFTSQISSEALMDIYEKLSFTPQGNVSIKLSTGEAGNTHYLDPNLIKDLVQSVDGTIVECNTAYGGSRASTAVHMQTAKDHGFTDIAEVDIMDADGSIQIPVSDAAENLEYDIVGKNYENYDSMIVLSHFKGHSMGGFGGAIKNISIGVASQSGKMYIHSAGHSDSSWSGGTQDQFLESMAEAAQAVHNDRQNNGGIIYISVMNHLSVDCDCDGNPAEPEMHDVGILASYDPVALDQACVDIVYNTNIDESGALRERIESRNGIHTLEHAAKIGLGSREYRLVSMDVS